MQTPLEAAQALAPRIAAAAPQAEAARSLPNDLMAALIDAGLFRLCIPASLGGLESDPATFVATVEALARADGAAGWCVMIGATSGLLAAYLPGEEAAALYGDARAVTGGVYSPTGRAESANGAYQVSGRWSFASGCQHCTSLMGACVVFDGDTPRMLANGVPDPYLFVFPAADADIIDTWHTSGLRGTGSHDISVAGIRVPAGRAVSLASDAPRASGSLYRFPVFGLLALGIASVALGIGRAAIAELVDIARGKTPAFSRRLLRDRHHTQVATAEAEAGLCSARAFLLDEVGRCWDRAQAGVDFSTVEKARLRLAAVHAVRGAVAATDLAYTTAGGTSIYATSPLQRQFRDVHTLTQHIMVAAPVLETAGRVLLGLEPDTPML